MITLELKKFKIKFFGSKNPKEQIKQVKMIVEAESREKVENVLQRKFGYKIINGLKIHDANVQDNSLA